MRRLPLPRVLAVLLVAGAGAVWVGGSADAQAPIKQGWWGRWQQQPTETTVGVTLPVTVPAPPTGDPGGLTIARDPTQVDAVAALLFQTDPGAGASLYLGTAGGRELVLPDDAKVRACVATKPWEGELNGPWVEAPAWGDDCVTGVVATTKLGIVWTLNPGMQDEDGAYDLVIVPDGQLPYSIDFAATGEQTLVAEEVPETTTTSTTEPVVEETTTPTTEPVVEETDPLVITEIPGTGPSAGVPVVTTAVPKTSPTSVVAFQPIGRPRIPGIPDSRAERIMAVSVLFFMATAMWWLGGSPTRMPRLIGALAGDGRVVSPPPEVARGVGRFARARDAVRPPRL